MNDRTAVARRVVRTGAGLGVLGTMLLRNIGPAGLNMTMVVLAAAVAAIVLQRRSGRTMSAESYTWLGVAVLAGGLFAWRDSEALNFLALVCACVALALPAARAGAAWLRNAGVAAYASALVTSGLAVLAGALPAVLHAEPGMGAAETAGRPAWRRARAVARGAALAAPLVLVFTGLLSAADPVFSSMLEHAVRFDSGLTLADVVLTAVLAWLATGYLYGFVAARPAMTVPAATPRLALGITEVGVALGVLNLLFLAFVLVQFRYLFGGATLVDITPGLTYAEYARRGFFELVLTVMLVLPVLLAADHVLRRRSLYDEAAFRALAGLQVLLVLGIAVSALERMRLYRSAYGLTEQRVYVTAALVLVVVVLVWFAATVLRGRRQRFAYGALVCSFCTVGALHVLNPDALIARTNVERALAGGGAQVAFDARYAGSLSADAMPVLLGALHTLPQGASCEVAARVLRRWPEGVRVSLRDWSRSESVAHRLVETRRAALERFAAAPECADPARGPTRAP